MNLVQTVSSKIICYGQLQGAEGQYPVRSFVMAKCRALKAICMHPHNLHKNAMRRRRGRANGGLPNHMWLNYTCFITCHPLNTKLYGNEAKKTPTGGRSF